jgi:hypothetical protein
MINILKNAYCFYVVQLQFNLFDNYKLNMLLDKIIDKDLVYKFVDGDEDIRAIFIHVCEYRKFNRCLISEEPKIPTKTFIKAFGKLLF